MSSTDPLIHLSDVKKVFYTDEVETHALSGIHLDIQKGEYLSIAGPSGCGKSTLLSILGLLDTPTDGEYVLNDHAVENLSLSERARIRNREVGFIFQSFNLIGDLTVYENVELPLTYRGMNSSERKKRVTEALERVGMGHRAKHLPSQLSGGQQQRVAVARAVGGQPSILLADEPTGNLDSTNGEAVMELLRELHRGGATICMVTHDPRYAQHADRIVHLFDGLIVEEEAGANRREIEEAKQELRESGFTSIMGPSGAGKSTLLHIIGMHDHSWHGEYVFDEVAVHSLNAKKRAELRNRNIGFVFQSYHLLDDQTVFENLELPLSYRDVGRKDRQSIVCDTLDRFQIVGKKDLYPTQLSGGQQQLVGIARAVVASPRLILADEPTGNLHSAQGKEIMDLFKRLNDEGTTIVQVTHSETNAAYGNRIVRLEDGWIVNN